MLNPTLQAISAINLVEAAAKIYLLARPTLETMIEHMPYFDVDLFSLESDPSLVPFLNFLKENEELTCSISTAIQFERREICDLIKRLSNDGLVRMTPRDRDIGSFSLCLTEKGNELACELMSGGGPMNPLNNGSLP